MKAHPNSIVSSFSRRLQEAMDVRSLTPSELSSQSGIDKPAISRYLQGKYKAKQDKLFILAETLDVSEAWLMGYDVPMVRRIPPPDSDAGRRLEEITSMVLRLTPEEQRLVAQSIKGILSDR